MSHLPAPLIALPAVASAHFVSAQNATPLPAFVSARRPSRVNNAQAASSLSTSSSSSAPSVAGAFFCDALETPLWCSQAQPLVLTHHARTRRHALYVVRQSQFERLKRSLADPHLRHRHQGMHAQLRERSMPLIVPPSDQDISSELVLEQIWISDHAQPPASSVFLASELDHTPLLCFHSAAAARLTALALDGNWFVASREHHTSDKRETLRVRVSWTRACTAAVALQSVRASPPAGRVGNNSRQCTTVRDRDAVAGSAFMIKKQCVCFRGYPCMI